MILAPACRDQPDAGHGGAAGGDQIVDQQDIVPGLMASVWISTRSWPYSRS